MPSEVRNSSLPRIFDNFPLSFSPALIPEVTITGIVIDSRRVEPGNLFIARRGGSVDGHEFIPEAIHSGAAAIVGDRDISGLAVPYIRVEDSVEAVTWLSAGYYDWPGRKLTVIGVTGTDGKTTTCNLLYHALLGSGLKVGMISTVNAVIGDEVLDTGFHVTTPDAPEVQLYLAKMVSAGISHVILETTSHGLAQHRVDASQYDIAVITNITHEHIDQHGTFGRYQAAKARLFQLLDMTSLKPQGNRHLAVLNRDDPSYEFLSSVVGSLRTAVSASYGVHLAADYRAEKIHYSPQGIHFEAIGPGFRIPVTSSLIGDYNVSNCLAALTVAIGGLGVDPETAARGLTGLTGIPGRMERIDLGQSFTAIVDFAHTPNAIRVAIDTARRMTDKRVIVVFGSAGLRDKDKRRMMAELSEKLADITILTAEDPRTEPILGILGEMSAGAKSVGGIEGRTYFTEADRRDAIRMAVRLAKTGDIVLVCGKGHEQSMCFGTVEYPWDDRVALRAAISESLDIPGPGMPFLPTQNKDVGK